MAEDYKQIAAKVFEEIREASTARMKAIDTVAAQGQMTEVLYAHKGGTPLEDAKSMMASLERAGNSEAQYIASRPAGGFAERIERKSGVDVKTMREAAPEIVTKIAKGEPTKDFPNSAERKKMADSLKGGSGGMSR